MERVLSFVGTISSKENKGLNKCGIKFNKTINLSEISIIPYGRTCHIKYKVISETYPNNFLIRIFTCNLSSKNNQNNYEFIGQITYKSNKTSLILNKAIIIDNIFIVGNYQNLTLNIYSNELARENLYIDDIYNKYNDNNLLLQSSNGAGGIIDKNISNTYLSLDAKIDEFGEIESDNELGLEIDMENISNFNTKSWKPISLQFNTHQALLSPPRTIPHPSASEFDKLLRKYMKGDNSEKNNVINAKCATFIKILKNEANEAQWLFALEDIHNHLIQFLILRYHYNRNSYINILKIITSVCIWAISKETWSNFPVLLNFRLLKIALKVLSKLFKCGKTVIIYIPMKTILNHILELLKDISDVYSIFSLVVHLIYNLSLTSLGAFNLFIPITDNNDITPSLASESYYEKFYIYFKNVTDKKLSYICVKLHLLYNLNCSLYRIEQIFKKYSIFTNDNNVHEIILDGNVVHEVSFDVNLCCNLICFVNEFLSNLILLKNKNNINENSELEYYKNMSKPLFQYMKYYKVIMCISFIIYTKPICKFKQHIYHTIKMILLICSLNKGRYYLYHEYKTINDLTTYLISETNSNEYLQCETVQYLLSNDDAIKNINISHVGFILIFTLQTVQIYDSLRHHQVYLSLKYNELTSTLHQLVCFTSSDIGLWSILTFFQNGSNTLDPILDLIIKYNISKISLRVISNSHKRYASYVVNKILQHFHHPKFILNNLSKFHKLINYETDTHSCEILGWIMSIVKVHSFHLDSCFTLIHFIIQALDEYDINIHSVRACATALHLIWYIICNNDKWTSQIESSHIKIELISKEYIISKLFEYGILEMNNKYVNKLQKVLNYCGILRYSYNYVYAIYRSFMPLLNINLLLIKHYKSIDFYYCNQKYIKCMFYLYSSFEYFKYYSFYQYDQLYQLFQIIIENLIYTTNVTHIKCIIDSLFSYVNDQPENINNGIIFLTKLLIQLTSLSFSTEIALSDILQSNIQNISNLIEVIINTSNEQIYTNLIFIVSIVCISHQSLCQSIISIYCQDMINHPKMYLKGVFILSLSKLYYLDIIVYESIFNMKNEQNIKQLLFYISQLNVDNENHITSIYIKYILYLIRILTHGCQVNNITIKPSNTTVDYLYINQLLNLLTKYNSTQYIQVLCKKLIKNIQPLLYMIEFYKYSSIYGEFLNNLFFTQTDLQIIQQLRKIFFHQLSISRPITSIKDIIIHDSACKYKIFDLYYEEKKTKNIEVVMNDIQKIIKFNIKYYKLEASNELNNNSTINMNEITLNYFKEFDIKTELMQLFRLKKLTYRCVERRRRFDPLMQMEKLILKMGSDHKIDKNFRESKIRALAHSFKSNPTSTSRLPSLHVDEYSMLKNANKQQPIFESNNVCPNFDPTTFLKLLQIPSANISQLTNIKYNSKT